MPVRKLDLNFAAGGHGWRETYYRNFPSAVLGQGLSVIETLAAKRAALNGYGVVIESYSLSDPIEEGRQGETVPFFPPKQGFHLTQDTGAATPSASINVAFSNDTVNLHRRIWMRGIWDSAIAHYNQLGHNNFVQWKALYEKWRDYVLEKQFGWMHSTRLGEPGICKYEYEAGKSVPLFTFEEPFFAEPFSQYRRVRFSGFNDRDSPLNRELVVKVISDVTCVAASPIAAGPMTGEGRCIQYGAPEFVVANNLGITRVGRRAPGRPLHRTPGRAKARARS